MVMCNGLSLQLMNRDCPSNSLSSWDMDSLQLTVVMEQGLSLKLTVVVEQGLSLVLEQDCPSNSWLSWNRDSLQLTVVVEQGLFLQLTVVLEQAVPPTHGCHGTGTVPHTHTYACTHVHTQCRDIPPLLWNVLTTPEAHVVSTLCQGVHIL